MAAGLEIHEAASSGDYDSLEEYLKSGKFDVNLKDEEWNNRTALHWACAKGFVECIRLLLDHGAQGTAVTDTGWTPAHFAAETGKLTVLRALHNAGISVIKKDIYGDSPRRLAEIYCHVECVKFLEMCEIEECSGDSFFGDYSRKYSLRSRLRSFGSSSRNSGRGGFSLASVVSRARSHVSSSCSTYESLEDEARDKRLGSGGTEYSVDEESRET